MGQSCRILLLALGLFAAACGMAHAESPGSDEVLSRLRSKAATVRSISSNFVQEKHLSVFDDTLISSGRFLYGSPDRLRWEYLTPITDGFVLNGRTGIRWEGATGTRREFLLNSDPVMSIVATQLLAWAAFDLTKLESEYRIEVACPSPTTLRLTPKSEVARQVISQLIIEFTPGEDAVRMVELQQEGGDYTRIRFEGTIVNDPLADNLFR